MKGKFTEEGVEKKVLEWLEGNGWDVVRGNDEYKRGSKVLDDRFGRKVSDVCYWDLLKKKIREINEDIDGKTAKAAVNKLKNEMDPENLVEGNKKFYKIIKNGVKVPVFRNGEKKTRVVKIIDKENIKNNSFKATNQYTFIRKSRKGIRPDVTLFVNGIPLINIECKSTAQNTTVEDAVDNINNYEEKEPRLFIPSLLNIGVDGKEFRYGAVKASYKYYFPWRSNNYKEGNLEFKDGTEDLLKPEKIMDIFRYFVFYEGTDTKIVPRYMQYRAANRMLERIKKGKRRKGLVWHTQGSGKSYTMLFTANKAKRSPEIEDKQYLLIVDRTKLEEQMEDTLESINFPLFEVADSKEHLEELLAENKSQLILTTIHKFGDVNKPINAEVDMETVILVDEAHRFMEEKLGSRLKMAVPEEKRYYFGFTGTPVKEGKSEKDRNTFNEFSHPDDKGYLHRYSIKRGQTDQVITPVAFKKRTTEWEIPEEQLDQDFEEEFEDLDPERKQEIIKKYVDQTELAEIRPRLEKVIRDIQKHYRENVMPNKFKSMVVTPSRRAAALYGDELRKYFDPEDVKVIITTNGDDPEQIRKYHLSAEKEQKVIKNFKRKESPKILVVCDKLLTGFDAPVLKTMYLDKSLKNHNLLQAIARTNRPCEGKENGEIVDYQGVFEDIEKVLQYDDIVIENAVMDEEELVKRFRQRVDQLMKIFDDIELENDPEVFHNCIVKLEKEEGEGVKFERVYSKAQNLYETLSPHEALVEEPLKTNWDILTQIYASYRDTEDGGRGSLGSKVREKTRKILEENLQVGDIENSGEVEYEIPERDVVPEKTVEQPDNQYGFITQALTKKKTLEEKNDKNIIYENLSERVKEIIEKWRNEDISGSDGLKELEKIEHKIEEEISEKETHQMTDIEFSLFKNLKKDFEESEDEAERIAKEIGERTEDISLHGYLPEIRRDIRRKILYALRDLDRTDLYSKEEEGFVNQTISYILANKE